MHAQKSIEFLSMHMLKVEIGPYIEIKYENSILTCSKILNFQLKYFSVTSSLYMSTSSST